MPRLTTISFMLLGATLAIGAIFWTHSSHTSASPVGGFRSYLPQVSADDSFIPGRIPRPNSSLTPGAVLTTDVPTICTPGYTATVRDVSDSTKDYVYRLYGISARTPGSYEIDHLISLELGGSNDLTNLWPESYEETNGARLKDVLENKLHDLICSGQLDITTAQHAIATDWYQAYLTYASTSANPTPAATTAPSPTVSASPTAVPATDNNGPWYTSSYASSTYYYCAADPGWRGLSPTYLLSYPTEAALLADWGGRRVKHPYAGC